MAVEKRHKNANWICVDSLGNATTPHAQLAVLMDIRDELQRLNRLLHCHNFQEIPHTLKDMKAALKAKRARKKAVLT